MESQSLESVSHILQIYQINLSIYSVLIRGPVGVDNLAIAVSEAVDTLTDAIEPYLIKAGFIARTPRGRVATKKAYDHLGKKQHEGLLF